MTMYHVTSTAAFRRALKRVTRWKDFDEGALRRVVDLLAQDEPLEIRYRDHELKGASTGIRECHVQNNILLLYRKDKKVLVLLLVDLGSHSELFGE